MSSPRLDEWLVDRGHYPSRARARDAINRGCVMIEGDVTAKPSRKVIDPSQIKISDPALRYVSRAALKLVSALEATGFSPTNKVCLDLGASTGGFCQVLLEHQAARVFGVDVGHAQLDAKLKNHPRLINIEGVNARDLSLEVLEGVSPEFITSDVSFISLKLALPPALQLATSGAKGIFLVKPQFEVGRDEIGKGGIVRNPEIAAQAAEDLKNWLDQQPGWRSTTFIPSPIKGGDGNAEFLLAGEKE